MFDSGFYYYRNWLDSSLGPSPKVKVVRLPAIIIIVQGTYGKNPGLADRR